MRIKPSITEKSLADAKDGKYTFYVPVMTTKYQIKQVIKNLFGADVDEVKTMNYKGQEKRSWRGRRTVGPKKKAIVTLKGKGKIDLFEEK